MKMRKKTKEKRDEVSIIIDEVSTEVSKWPEWLKKNAESIVVSAKVDATSNRRHKKSKLNELEF